MQGAEPTGPGHLWTTAREYLTHWVIAGLILSLTGFVPEEWFAKLVEELALPERVRTLWPEGLDPRAAIFALGVAIIVADIVLRRRVAAHGKGADAHAAPASAIPSISSQEEASGGAVADAPGLTIVVLPFANIGGNPEHDYFVDGVTESLTTDLSRISGSIVIARNTAFTYKGKAFDASQIGHDLNVRYLVEGSVQRSDSRIRVNVQLIDAATGNSLWADRFDKPLGDLFDLQDEIVAQLARQLDAAVVAAEARRAARAPRLDSLDLYFEGMACIHKGANPENLTQAKGYFERALALDASNVEASVRMLWADLLMTSFFMADDRARRMAAIEANVAKLLSLAPHHAFAHFLLGAAQVARGRAEGIAECERALALDRNLAEAHAYIGLGKIMRGKPEETEAHVREALRLSPRDPGADLWMGFAGRAKFAQGAYPEAIQWANRSLEVNRNLPMTHFLLATTLAHLGRLDEARAAAAAGLALDPRFTLARYGAGAPREMLGYERFLEGLREAGVPAE